MPQPERCDWRMEMGDAELKRIATAARERTLAEHTAEHRVN